MIALEDRGRRIHTDESTGKEFFVSVLWCRFACPVCNHPFEGENFVDFELVTASPESKISEDAVFLGELGGNLVDHLSKEHGRTHESAWQTVVSLMATFFLVAQTEQKRSA